MGQQAWLQQTCFYISSFWSSFKEDLKEANFVTGKMDPSLVCFYLNRNVFLFWKKDFLSYKVQIQISLPTSKSKNKNNGSGFVFQHKMQVFKWNLTAWLLVASQLDLVNLFFDSFNCWFCKKVRFSNLFPPEIAFSKVLTGFHVSINIW